jgi:hypothetical protein
MRRNNRGPANGSATTRLKVAKDAALGPRELRVVTPRGVSSVGLVVVVAEPVAVEADDKANDRPNAAQALALPVAVSGAISKVEDVDWYAVPIETGRTITFRVWGNRLEDKIHDLQTHFDPILVLHAPDGRELGASDNAEFADPRLTFRARESGTYLLEIRDTTYAGNPNWTYVLQGTAGPFVEAVTPMAVRPSQKAELHASGPNLDKAQAISLDVPGDVPLGPIALPLSAPMGETFPVPLVATDLPIVLETDDAPAEADKAQKAEWPAALCGTLNTPNDADAFVFEAKKGHKYALEVVARRAGSECDPVLRVLDAKGKMLAEADDTFGKDPRLEFNAPNDGPLVVRVLDLHGRGGDTFGYVLLAQEAASDFVLSCDPDKLNVGLGSRVPLFVKVDRRGGFDGPVRVALDGLPAGLSASPLTIPKAMTQGVIVVSASGDAKPAAALVRLSGKADMASGSIEHMAAPRQEIYLPGGGRGLYNVSTLAAAVTEPSDITVEAQPAELTLKPGGRATINVTIARKPGFELPVNLAVELRHLGSLYVTTLPPGVAVRLDNSKTLVGPKATTGTIVLEAKGDASPTPEPVPITVMGHVSINFVVKTAYCSAPIAVRVGPK